MQDLRERLGEVVHELLLAVARGVHLGDRAQLGVRGEHQVSTGAGPLALRPGALVVRTLGRPGRVHVEQVDEVVVRQHAHAVGEHAQRRVVVVGAQHAQAADQDGQLRRGQAQQLRPIDQVVLLRQLGRRTRVVVAEPVEARLQVAEGLDVGLLLARIDAARLELDLDRGTAVRCGLLDRRDAAQHDQVSDRDGLAALTEGALDVLQLGQHLGQLLGVVDLPVLLRLEADASAVGAAALVRVAEARGRRPRGRHQFRHGQTGVEDLLLEAGDVLRRQRLGRGLGQRVLPDERVLGNLGTEVAGHRTQVAVGQLEPGLGELLSQLLGVIEPAARDLAVDRVDLQRDVAHQHRRLARGATLVRGGDDRLGVLGDVLPGVGR